MSKSIGDENGLDLINICMLCRYCRIKTSPNKSGLTRHEKHCKLNPSSIPNNGRFIGVTGNPRFKHSEETKRKLSEKATGRARTVEAEEDRRRKIKEKAKISNGGYRRGSGRGKKGWYKGFFCDSSWELAYLIYCIDHGISISRNTEIRQYEINGRIKNYIPDFIVDGKLIEIKGYKSEEWLAKHRSNQDIEVLYKDDLSKVLEYVINKYGKNYINLYEGR